jgi:hypothetical protein
LIGGLFDNVEMTMTDTVYDSAASQKDNIEGMKKYFRVVEKSGRYEFWCLKCKKGWGLPSTNNHPGNYLHMLNHAYSHIKKK